MVQRTSISANEVVLCATNEGGLYEEHLALAKYSEAKGQDPMHTLAMWLTHVNGRVLPYLMTQGGYKGERLFITLDEQSKAAQNLREYYINRINEA